MAPNLFDIELNGRFQVESSRFYEAPMFVLVQVSALAMGPFGSPGKWLIEGIIWGRTEQLLLLKVFLGRAVGLPLCVGGTILQATGLKNRHST